MSGTAENAPLTREQLTELRRINDTVPAVPWKVWDNLHGDPLIQVDKPGRIDFVTEASKSTPQYGRVMAKRLAAFDPVTVTAMLDLIDRQAAALAGIQGWRQDLRELAEWDARDDVDK